VISLAAGVATLAVLGLTVTLTKKLGWHFGNQTSFPNPSLEHFRETPAAVIALADSINVFVTPLTWYVTPAIACELRHGGLLSGAVSSMA
jgi:hypothetical protein